ncbi:MAG: DUF5060 domain-containing protein [Bacteroidia bacterium]|nr:DUF5060 domain-containing protein [Bacteroidia bacterium]
MAQGPKIDSIKVLTPVVEQYGKFEIRVFARATFSNPYDYEQVKISSQFVGPGGESKMVDAFYMEGYKFMGTGGAISTTGEDGFFLRFSPNRTGQWTFQVFLQDGMGVDTFAMQSFNVQPAMSENQKGFLRLGNSNYLKFDNEEAFIPVGHNIAWQNGSVYANYTSWLGALKSSGGNYFRLWHCHWGLSLEWLGNGYGGLKDYRQSNAFYLDWLHDYCEQQGIYTMVCLQHHGQVSTQVNPNWSESPYNQANGGMCANTWEFFTDSTAKAATKNRLRYIIARWGYSRSIMAWELFNEVNWTDNFVQNASDIADWHAEMAEFLRELDPNEHLITTSLAENNERELFWSLPEMEISQNHNYSSNPRIERVLANASKDALETFDKPTLNGEFGITTGGGGLSSTDPDGIHLHNGIWGGFFGGGLGSSGSWWWDSYIHPRNLYYHYEAFSTLSQLIDFEKRKYQPAKSYTTGNSGDLSMIPSLGWGQIGDDSIDIDANGQITGAALLGEYLYGATWNTQFRSPPTFMVDFEVQGELIVRTGSEKAQDPKITIWLNGNIVLNSNANTNTDYVINIPAGQHSIKVDNTGTDWVKIAYYKFTGIGSLLESYVLMPDSADELTAWILNPKYNHEEVSQSQIPDPVSGSELVVPDFQNGTYYAKWYDCLTGAWKATDSVTVLNDTLVLPIPELVWDLSLVVDQKFFVSNEEVLLDTEVNVFPNPIKAGKNIKISGEFPYVKGYADLVDVQGRLVQRLEIKAFDWETPYELNLSKQIQPGHYWLIINLGEQRAATHLKIND